MIGASESHQNACKTITINFCRRIADSTSDGNIANANFVGYCNINVQGGGYRAGTVSCLPVKIAHTYSRADCEAALGECAFTWHAYRGPGCFCAKRNKSKTTRIC